MKLNYFVRTRKLDRGDFSLLGCLLKRVLFTRHSHVNLQGEEIIAVIPWDEWWDLSLKDSSNPQIALLPLHPDVRAKFNNTAAWEYARSMSGKPYGYHNMIFSWIDTITDNYPPPLDAHLVGISTKNFVITV